MLQFPNNFVFFGTPEPAVQILEKLREAEVLPKLIVTNPDKPQGRKMILTPPPVKVWALKNNIPILQPARLDSKFILQLLTLNYQLFLVVAYGGIIPKEILEIPKFGSLNVHYSLLPKYRGATPVESQILNDDKNVGVSIMLLDEKMDHGPIVAQKNLQLTTYNLQLNWPPTATDLRKKCNEIAGKLLLETVPLWIEGKIKPKEQEHAKATYTKKITAKDREINLAENGYKNFLKIQAFEAWGSYFFADYNGKKIRVTIKKVEFRDNNLILLKVIPEGKKEMSYDDFLRGMKSEKIA